MEKLSSEEPNAVKVEANLTETEPNHKSKSIHQAEPLSEPEQSVKAQAESEERLFGNDAAIVSPSGDLLQNQGGLEFKSGQNGQRVTPVAITPRKRQYEPGKHRTKQSFGFSQECTMPLLWCGPAHCQIRMMTC